MFSHGAATAEARHSSCHITIGIALQVSRALYDVMKHSRHHVTTGELWERRYQELLATPNHVWREEGEATLHAWLPGCLQQWPSVNLPAAVEVEVVCKQACACWSFNFSIPLQHRNIFSQPRFTALPLPSIADEADRYRAALLNTLLASFPKYLSHANVHVKALPLGNRSIIVPVKRSSPGGDAAAAAAARAQALYVVDLSALSPGEVHRRLAEDDSSFRCDDQNCACLAIALEVSKGRGCSWCIRCLHLGPNTLPYLPLQDAAIHAIRKVHSVYEATLRRELRLEQHKHRGLGWRGASFESPHQPPAPASTPQPGPHAEQHAHATPTQTGPGAGVPGGFPSSFAGGASPAASFAGGGGPPASSAAGGGPPARNEDAGGSSADMVFERTPLLQTAELKAAVRGSLDPSGGRQPCRVRLGGLHRPGAAAAEVTAAHDCRESRGDLVQSPIVVGGGKYLFLPEGVAPSSVSAVQVGWARATVLEGLRSGLCGSMILAQRRCP